MQRNSGAGPADFNLSISGAINLIYLIANCLACITLPFIRFGMGGEGIGFFGIGALVILLFWGGATGSATTLAFIGLWLAAVCIQRMRSIWGWARGEVTHSRYQGDPLVSCVVKSNRLARLVVEPALVAAVGFVVDATVSPALGMLLMVSGASILVIGGFDYLAEFMRLRAMHDARLEMEHMAGLYRGRVRQ